MSVEASRAAGPTVHQPLPATAYATLRGKAIREVPTQPKKGLEHLNKFCGTLRFADKGVKLAIETIIPLGAEIAKETGHSPENWYKAHKMLSDGRAIYGIFNGPCALVRVYDSGKNVIKYGSALFNALFHGTRDENLIVSVKSPKQEAFLGTPLSVHRLSEAETTKCAEDTTVNPESSQDLTAKKEDLQQIDLRHLNKEEPSLIVEGAARYNAVAWGYFEVALKFAESICELIVNLTTAVGFGACRFAAFIKKCGTEMTAEGDGLIKSFSAIMLANHAAWCVGKGCLIAYQGHAVNRQLSNSPVLTARDLQLQKEVRDERVKLIPKAAEKILELGTLDWMKTFDQMHLLPLWGRLAIGGTLGILSFVNASIDVMED